MLEGRTQNNFTPCFPVQTFRGFAGALKEAASGASEEEAAGGAATGSSWQTVLTGLLRAFARHHYAEAAGIANQVSAEIFNKDSGLANEIIVIVNLSLHP